MLYRSKATQKNCAETLYVTRVADESIGLKSAFPKDSYQKNAPTQNKHPPT